MMSASFMRAPSDRTHVRRALAGGANGFEGLKVTLELRWGEMNQELGIEQLDELRPIYDQLQGLKLKSTRTTADVAREKAARGVRMLDNLEAMGRARKAANLSALTDAMEREAESYDDERKRRIRNFIDGLSGGRK
jgi:hypothetical protein